MRVRVGHNGLLLKLFNSPLFNPLLVSERPKPSDLQKVRWLDSFGKWLWVIGNLAVSAQLDSEA